MDSTPLHAELPDLVARLCRRVAAIEQHLGIQQEPTPPSADDSPAIPAGPDAASSSTDAPALPTTARISGESGEAEATPATPAASREAPGDHDAPSHPPIAPHSAPAASSAQSTATHEDDARLSGAAMPAHVASPHKRAIATRLSPPVDALVADSARPRRSASGVRGKSSAHNARPTRSLELAIGRMWVGWIGAIVVLLGAGYFVKHAYDQGWIHSIHPAVRCIISALFGLSLISCGEVARRKIGRVASGGLFAAGVGTLYVTCYAALRMNLVGELGALGLLGVTTLIGFAISWRAQYLAMGVLSVLAGYFSPMMLSGPASFPAIVPNALPLYLTMLLGIALALSMVNESTFRTLRFVAMSAHGVMALGWVFLAGADWAMTLPFLGLWWVMVTCEVIVAATRGQSARGNVAASVLATAWFVTIGAFVINGVSATGDRWIGAFTIGIGMLAAIGAVQFGPSIAKLRRRITSAIAFLAVALWAQAGVLLVTAIALQFDGFGTSVGWLAVAIGAVEIGRRLGLRAITAFGQIVAALAVFVIIEIAALSGLRGPMHVELFGLGPIAVTRYSLLLLLGFISANIIAWRAVTARDADAATGRTIIAGIGALMWMAACALTMKEHFVTGGWLVGALMMAGHRRVLGIASYGHVALFMVTSAAGLWLGRDVLGALYLDVRPSAVDAGAPFANARFVMALMILVVGGLILLGQRIRRDDENSDDAQPSFPSSALSVALPGWRALELVVCILAGVLLVAIAVEVDQLVIAGAGAIADGPWTAPFMRLTWQIILAGGFAAVVALSARVKQWALVHSAASGLAAIAAVVWLLPGSLSRLVGEGIVHTTPLVNLQTLGGAVALASLAWMVISGRDMPGRSPFTRQRDLTAIALLGLWIGSFEAARMVAPGVQAMQTALSVWWALYSVGLVTVGFRFRSAACRWAGLVLFAITVGKVLIVDTAGLQQLYRVMSAVFVGLLLLGTSVAYAKIAPRLIGESDDAADEKEHVPRHAGD